MYKETFPFVDGWVVPPFYQRTVSFAFHSFNLDEKRGGCISWRSEAFAFGIVKSPCYEFTHSDFTIPTATERRYIPTKTLIEIKQRLLISPLMRQPLAYP